MITFIKNLFTRKYTKEEVLGFAEHYWIKSQSSESPYNYSRRKEKMFNEWLKQK